MTEQKNSSEKTEKTDRNEKPASAPKKPSIEPKSARGASTTARRNAAAGAKASRTAHAAHAPAVLDRRAFLKILPAHEKTSLKHQTHSEL